MWRYLRELGRNALRAWWFLVTGLAFGLYQLAAQFVFSSTGKELRLPGWLWIAVVTTAAFLAVWWACVQLARERDRTAKERDRLLNALESRDSQQRERGRLRALARTLREEDLLALNRMNQRLRTLGNELNDHHSVTKLKSELLDHLRSVVSRLAHTEWSEAFGYTESSSELRELRDIDSIAVQQQHAEWAEKRAVREAAEVLRRHWSNAKERLSDAINGLDGLPSG